MANAGKTSFGHPRYRDHLSSCRSCFLRIEKITEQNRIQDWHREVFGSLTGVAMVNKPGMSANLCMKCIHWLTTVDNLGKRVFKLQSDYYKVMKIDADSMKVAESQAVQCSAIIPPASSVNFY